MDDTFRHVLCSVRSCEWQARVTQLVAVFSLKREEPVVKVMRAKQVTVAVRLRALKLLPERLCLLMSVALRIMGQLLATISQAS